MNIEEVAFRLIAFAGSARSSFIESMQCSKKGDFASAEAKIQEGREAFNQAHQVHLTFLADQSDPEKASADFHWILVHAEDQLMSAETFSILAEEWKDLYHQVLGASENGK